MPDQRERPGLLSLATASPYPPPESNVILVGDKSATMNRRHRASAPRKTAICSSTRLHIQRRDTATISRCRPRIQPFRIASKSSVAPRQSSRRSAGAPPCPGCAVPGHPKRTTRSEKVWGAVALPPDGLVSRTADARSAKGSAQRANLALIHEVLASTGRGARFDLDPAGSGALELSGMPLNERDGGRLLEDGIDKRRPAVSPRSTNFYFESCPLILPTCNTVRADVATLPLGSYTSRRSRSFWSLLRRRSKSNRGPRPPPGGADSGAGVAT